MTLLLGLLFLSLRRLTAPLIRLAWPSPFVVRVSTALTTAPSCQPLARLFHAPTPILLT